MHYVMGVPVYAMLLEVATLLAAVSASTASDHCTPPPLWVFSLPEDLQSLFPAITEPFVLVEEGQTAEILRSPGGTLQSLVVLDENILGFPLVWCVNRQQGGLPYSIAVTSLDPSVLLDPVLSVPNLGNISQSPYRFHVTFQCVRVSETPVLVEVVVNITAPDEQLCPVVFYFAKSCRRVPDVPERSAILSELELRDGFVNVSIQGKERNNDSMLVDTQAQGVPLALVLEATLIPIAILALILLLFVLWGLWYRSRSKAIAVFEPEAVSLAYQRVYPSWQKRGAHEKEFSPEQLQLVRELGEGAFGIVFQAEANGIVEDNVSTVVAVKQLRKSNGETTQVEEFFREVDFMSKLDHPNIVRLLGVCSLEEPFSMIFEYMDLGDLCSFLREAAGLGGEEETQCLLTNQELICIAQQVVDGMVYISSQHLVHRDLATRNCLVATGLIVKIADFGMSRDVHSSDYYRVQGSALLPVRWMPPESILYGKFTSETDVWAFGVLLWELFTFGQQPYPGLTNEEVIEYVQKPEGHPKPPEASPLAQLMCQCWRYAPKKRPTFPAIAEAIQEVLAEIER